MPAPSRRGWRSLARRGRALRAGNRSGPTCSRTHWSRGGPAPAGCSLPASRTQPSPRRPADFRLFNPLSGPEECKYIKVLKCWEYIPAKTKQLSPCQRPSSCCFSGTEARVRNAVPFRGARAAAAPTAHSQKQGGSSALDETTNQPAPQKGNPEPELNQDTTISIPLL